MTIRAARPTGEHQRIEPALDHLVYATPDLDETVAEFFAVTGIRPAAGGRHLGRGTRNHLIGLGPARYLEIIGPDTDNPLGPGAALPFGIDRLTTPALLTWAVRPADLVAAAVLSAAAGADLGAPLPMSRRTAAGDLLQWTLASAVPLPFDGVTPFLIDWGTTEHPAADPDLPSMTLDELNASHPEPSAVNRVLDALGVSVPVEPGPSGLRAALGTPNGTVVLG